MEFTHMVISKINGTVISRHASQSAAIKKIRANDSNYSPLELREYSQSYYEKMAL